ncbi:MAG: hypothetical protein GTO30_10790, partial [Acidobacteria bacterium]|nr:hypothetical protein [Acidobacteriota bacterium]NIQ84215.1 hypothetical protein [Acidobacteriota bacterium]
PALVVGLLLSGRHLIEGLFAGILVTVVVGWSTGRLQPEQLVYVDLENFGARGLIVDGVERAVG